MSEKDWVSFLGLWCLDGEERGKGCVGIDVEKFKGRIFGCVMENYDVCEKKRWWEQRVYLCERRGGGEGDGKGETATWHEMVGHRDTHV